jgi:hypothetical protein
MKQTIVHWAWLGVVAAAAVMTGCGEPSAGDPAGSLACNSRLQVACSCSDGRQGSASCNPDGQSVGVCQCSGTTTTTGGQLGASGGSPSASGGQVGASGSTSNGLPCDVKAIIETNCATCHGATPTFGAPMPLVSATHFRAKAQTTNATVGQQTLVRLDDNHRPMPPPPNERLSSADHDVLKRWIESGAPDGTCGPATSGAGGAGMGGMPEPLPADVTCYDLTARASAAGAKYSVPTTPDLYQCFQYSPPWGAKKVQVVSAKPLIDNAQVLHHWNLYNSPDAVTDGTNGGCSGAHPNAALIAGWAPGGQDLVLPPDVGLRTEPGGFSLEMHYNNQLGAGQMDASGVRVCVTEKMRPKEAAVHWLGTQSLNKLTATGTCTPSPFIQEPVTIISSSPHMHLQGRHMKTVINRKDGRSEVLIDKPFDFNTQIAYPTPAVINPGDTLSTTCTFATPTPFGQGTNEEMCYNFVMAYPAGGLGQLLQVLRKYDCSGI